MKKSTRVSIVVVAVILATLSIYASAVAFQMEYANYRTEAVCIQGWVDMGVERKNIHRENGDCFYSKTTNKWGN